MDILALVNEHLGRYPDMEPQDIIKLIYQNEFGGGHMIDSFENSFQRLKDECDSLDEKSSFLSTEKIGDNLIHVNLTKLNEFQLKALNQIFVVSSKQKSGNLTAFIEKLSLVKQAMEIKEIDYDSQLFTQELTAYEKLNFPPISHSNQYRQLYQPHYRVVDRRYFNYFDLIVKINQLITTNEHLIIAIDGIGLKLYCLAIYINSRTCGYCCGCGSRGSNRGLRLTIGIHRSLTTTQEIIIGYTINLCCKSSRRYISKIKIPS